jgi:hypothetical protein
MPSQHCESLEQLLPSRTQEQRFRPFWSVITFFVQHFLHGCWRFPPPQRLPAGVQFSALTSPAAPDDGSRRRPTAPATGRTATNRTSPRREPGRETAFVRVSNRLASMVSWPPSATQKAAVETQRHKDADITSE